MTIEKTAVFNNQELALLIAEVANNRCQQSFMQLFEHYAPLIRAFSLAREPGATFLADELAQDVLVKVWEKAHQFKPEVASLNAWVYTLARNCRIDHFRKNGRYKTDIDPSYFENLEDDQNNPFQATEDKKLQKNIHQSIDKLPVEQRQVLAKVYIEGKTQQETANELDLPLGTVKSRIRLALQKLELLLRGTHNG